MRFLATTPGITMALSLLAATASTTSFAQQSGPLQADVAGEGEQLPDPATMTEGPDIKGVLTARQGDRIQVEAADGTRTVLVVNETTQFAPLAACSVRAAPSSTLAHCSTACR